jgi:putative ABC transport system permease protein
MLQNYFRVALRLIRKNKIFSLINIFGLATGIACCIIITLYVQDELAFEKGFADHDKVYLINTTWSSKGVESTSAFSSPPIAMDMARELPEVEMAARMFKAFDIEQHIVRYNEKTFFEKNVFFVDSTFLNVFPYTLAEGDARTALANPSSLLISETLAKKIFGNKSPLNEMLVVNSADTFQITGVVAKGRYPSHADADLYMTLSGSSQEWLLSQTTWANNNMAANYIKLSDPGSLKTVQAKMTSMLEAKAGQELRDSGRKKSLSLQPLDDVRLHSDMKNGDREGPGITYLYIICCIGLLILLLGCINFMNLTTARSAHRAAEVGVRKSMGAYRGHLIRQFLGESFIIVIISLLLAFLIAELTLPFLNPVIRKDLQFTSTNLPFILIATAAIGLVTALLSGSYPAFYLSSLKPTQILKGKGLTGGASWLRKGLVVFQFVITIALISSIVIIQNQLRYMQSKSLGFNSKQLVMIPMRTQDATTQYPTLKSQFMSVRGVNEVSATTSLPSTPLFRDWMVYRKGWNSEQALRHEVISVDENYFKTLGVPMLAGRDFRPESDNLDADTLSPTKIIVNESSLRAFDVPLDDAIGTTIYFKVSDQLYEFSVIGVVKDFHQFSMHQKIGPMLFMYPGNQNNFPYTAASIDPGSYESVHKELKTIWDKQVSSLPFEMIFVDDNIREMYAAERRMSGLLSLSTFIALVISGLGLYGLSVYVAERKTKEIGIRKISGASVLDIVSMLSKEYLILILISFTIAAPIGYYVMNKWLEGFAFKIEPGIGIFLLSGTLAFLVAWITISFESLSVARRNPVDTLRQN